MHHQQFPKGMSPVIYFILSRHRNVPVKQFSVLYYKELEILYDVSPLPSLLTCPTWQEWIGAFHRVFMCLVRIGPFTVGHIHATPLPQHKLGCNAL